MSLEDSRGPAASLDGLADAQLLALSQERDEGAFAEFVRRHADGVHRWMARAVGEQDADDLTQEVFFKAYRGLGRFRGEAPPRAWLAAIADNVIKNRYRALGRFRRIFAPAPVEDPPPDPTAPSEGPEESARAGESRRFVAEALKRLPAEYRMPVVLRDLEEWSYEEIAASLGVPLGTVKSRIARGRERLKAILVPWMSSEKRPT